MTRTRLIILALAAIMLAVLLFFWGAPREGGRYGEAPKAPLPARAPAAEVGVEEKAPEPAAAGKGARGEKAGGSGKPEKRRKKRVSRLREPGEAMGGGVRLDKEKTNTSPQEGK